MKNRNRRTTVLIVDESTSVRASLAKVLRAAGYEVLMACHGRDALECLSRQEADLVMLDLDMPEMDGWEALQRIAEDHPELPVLVVTGQAGERDWARSHGAAGLLEKPLDMPHMLEVLEEITEPLPRERRPRKQSRPVFRYSPPKPVDFRFGAVGQGG
jgi:DNA-binding NtrC family response regulator